MTIWISMPSVVIPKPTAVEMSGQIDPQYRRIFQAFSHPLEKVEDHLRLPRAGGMTSEILAASAMRPLLEDHAVDGKPGMLVDCRSSAAIGGVAPTFKLA